MYNHLKKTREEERLKLTMLSEVLQYIQDSSACQQWLCRQAETDSGLTPSISMSSNSGRGSAPPLNLTGLSGMEKLNVREKELYQMVRLVPGAYLEYKSAFLNECNKQGGLRLAQARALVKIDVGEGGVGRGLEQHVDVLVPPSCWSLAWPSPTPVHLARWNSPRFVAAVGCAWELLWPKRLAEPV
ncbi:Transcriptional adapter 2-alpha [Sciurus carolinensis]|uniref:Transcriptional adapter 2-alpha n=1 Tax=Sciurus carolinensis TaxID=30640 RepID=A0AA41TBG8_SCICA|nr:Transcriptional adapter 2-alpha [Sciurus carolinensis]